MKLNKYCTLFAFAILSITPLSANLLNENLIQGCTQSGILFGCHIKEGVLHSSAPFEMTHSVKYSFPATGRPLFVGIVINNTQVKFKQGSKNTATITGTGALEIKDFNKSRTAGAALGKGSSLSLTSVSSDISSTSKTRLDNWLAQRDRLISIQNNVKSVESAASTILSLVTQLNPSQILSLMQGLRKDVVEMQNITPKRRDKRTIQGVINIIDFKIAENPGFNDKDLKKKVTTSLNKLIAIAPDATNLLQEEIETLNADAEDILSYASNQTKDAYASKMQ